MELEIYICIRDAMNHCDRKEYSIAVARLTEAQTIEGKLRRHHFTAGNSQMINPEH